MQAPKAKTYLGSTTVTTDSTSNASFSTVFNGVTVPAGSFISATATDPLGNTSEFAKDIQPQTVADLGITGSSSASTAYVGDDVTYTFKIINAGPDSATASSSPIPCPRVFLSGISARCQRESLRASAAARSRQASEPWPRTPRSLSRPAQVLASGPIGHEYRQRHDHVLRSELSH